MAATGAQALTARLQWFGLARDQLRSALASGAGITPADLDALEHLEAAGPLTQRQLGDRLALTSGAITMLVDRLVRGGWVRRRPHPTDRRSVLVELSPRAAERTPAALAAFHARVVQIAADVPEPHREAIARFLSEAAAAAADAAADLRRPP
jgi:DNA-binding MarR family transcriptional regulator